MARRLGPVVGGVRSALTSRPARVLITAACIATFAWRGYVLFSASNGSDDGPSLGVWLLVWGAYLLLRCTWWRTPPSDASDQPSDASSASAPPSR